jgi:hypothetical protein
MGNVLMCVVCDKRSRRVFPITVALNAGWTGVGILPWRFFNEEPEYTHLGTCPECSEKKNALDCSWWIDQKRIPGDGTSPLLSS